MMEIVLEKAYFEKQDVVKLIKMLPFYMQETAVLIAIGRYKHPDVHLTGMYNNKVYTVKDINAFDGINIVNTKDYKDTRTVSVELWKQCVLDYQQYQKDKQKEYEEKCAEITKEVYGD